MTPQRTATEIRAVNIEYHDAAAEGYDSKWGITFDVQGQTQVIGKLLKATGLAELGPFDRSLEIGAGTGYFSLNLLLAGVVRSAVCVDISPAMLRVLQANADRLGLEVQTAQTSDAEPLPFAEESFDFLFGHAVLHHLPDLRGSFRDFHRVLTPGGLLAFAGEPSLHGDRIAAYPKRAAVAAAPLWRRLMGAQAAHEHSGRNGAGSTTANGTAGGDHGLEFAVDVHAFSPTSLSEHASDAGFSTVRVRGEELLASWFGWANRTLEGTARPDDIPWLWRQYAHKGYLALQQVDRRLLESRLPPALFYNLMVSARKPA